MIKSARESYALALKYSDILPNFVKSASTRDLHDPDLPPHQYVDPSRELPADNPAAICWSLVTALEHDKHAAYVPALLKRARMLDVGQQAEALIARHKELQDKSAREIVEWRTANSFTTPYGAQIPMTGPGQVADAARHLVKYAYSYDRSTRKQMAQRIEKAAADHGCDLPKIQRRQLTVMAGRGAAHAKQAGTLLSERAEMAQHAGDQESAEQLARLAGIYRAEDRWLFGDELEKVAAALEEADDRYPNGSRSWRATPVDELCRLTLDDAVSWLDGMLKTASGKVYRRDDLSGLSPGDVAAIFGAEFDGIVLDTNKLAVTLTTNRERARLFDDTLGRRLDTA